MSEILTPEVLPAGTMPTALEAIERAQTDIQVATAKRYPRSLKEYKTRAIEMATLDEETAASCFYKLPRDGKIIEGESVRLAEIVAAAYKNVSFGARVIEITETHVVAQGVAIDWEANTRSSSEIRVRITKKDGKRYGEDMISTASNAACAKALRNAIFKVVPRALVKPILEAAKKVAVGDLKTLAERRSKMLEAYSKIPVTKEKILAFIDKKGIEDIGLDELEVLLGTYNAIKAGEISVDEVFNTAPKDSDARFAKEQPPEVKK
jgi:hypothetical protein